MKMNPQKKAKISTCAVATTRTPPSTSIIPEKRSTSHSSTPV